MEGRELLPRGEPGPLLPGVIGALREFEQEWAPYFEPIKEGQTFETAIEGQKRTFVVVEVEKPQFVLNDETGAVEDTGTTVLSLREVKPS